MRRIVLEKNGIKELLSEGEVYYGCANKTIQLFDVGNGLELQMNWNGDGYKPMKMIIEFEYDEKIKFTENEV